MGDKERIAELEAQLAALAGEVERLKGMDDAMIRLALCHDIKDALVKERDTLRAEVERLRLDAISALGQAQTALDERDALRAEVAALKIDNQTLRDLLAIAEERNEL